MALNRLPQPGRTKKSVSQPFESIILTSINPSDAPVIQPKTFIPSFPSYVTSKSSGPTETSTLEVQRVIRNIPKTVEEIFLQAQQALFPNILMRFASSIQNSELPQLLETRILSIKAICQNINQQLGKWRQVVVYQDVKKTQLVQENIDAMMKQNNKYQTIRGIITVEYHKVLIKLCENTLSLMVSMFSRRADELETENKQIASVCETNLIKKDVKEASGDTNSTSDKLQQQYQKITGNLDVPKFSGQNIPVFVKVSELLSTANRSLPTIFSRPETELVRAAQQLPRPAISELLNEEKELQKTIDTVPPHKQIEISQKLAHNREATRVQISKNTLRTRELFEYVLSKANKPVPSAQNLLPVEKLNKLFVASVLYHLRQQQKEVESQRQRLNCKEMAEMLQKKSLSEFLVWVMDLKQKVYEFFKYQKRKIDCMYSERMIEIQKKIEETKQKFFPLNYESVYPHVEPLMKAADRRQTKIMLRSHLEVFGELINMIVTISRIYIRMT